MPPGTPIDSRRLLDKPVRLAIVGVADYPPYALWEQAHAFVESVPRAGRDTLVVLITRPLGTALRSRLERAGVYCLEAIPRVPSLRWRRYARRLLRLPGSPWLPPRLQASIAFLYDVCVYRHFLYRMALEQCRADYVLLTDVRDVIFQAEIPPHAFTDTLLLSQENSQVVIRDEPWTFNWIAAGYGRTAALDVQHKPVLCAGLTFGRRDLVVAYSDAMLQAILCLPRPARILEGVDQGVHNWLAYSGGLGDWAVSSAESGWMRTIGLLPGDSLRWTASGHLSNPDGAAVPIVHQYDRHWADPRIRAMLAACGARAHLGEYQTPLTLEGVFGKRPDVPGSERRD